MRWRRTTSQSRQRAARRSRRRRRGFAPTCWRRPCAGRCSSISGRPGVALAASSRPSSNASSRRPSGKIALVKMNIDDHPEIAEQLGVKSIPAVVAFQRGRPVDGFVGALPESQIKGFIERLVGPIEDPLDAFLSRRDADRRGRPRRRGGVVDRIGRTRPAPRQGDRRTRAALHRNGAARGGARVCSTPYPRRSAATRRWRRLARRSKTPSAPWNWAKSTNCANAPPSTPTTSRPVSISRWRSTPRENAKKPPMRSLTSSASDRSWNDDGASKQLIQFFEAWGPMDPAAVGARRRLSTLLFS